MGATPQSLQYRKLHKDCCNQAKKRKRASPKLAPVDPVQAKAWARKVRDMEWMPSDTLRNNTLTADQKRYLQRLEEKEKADHARMHAMLLKKPGKSTAKPDFTDV